MNERLNRAIQAELERLGAQGVLNADQVRRIGERYPCGRWNLVVLIRWFTILGGVTAVAGLVILAHTCIDALRLGELGLAAASVGLIWLARWLARTRKLERTGAVLEMVAGCALQGLTVLLAIDFASGSNNWPALVGWQSLMLAAMAYALRNRLVLIHAGICFFTFFGGETGYDSGWGAYWLEMDYPARYLVAGAAFLAVAWLHAVYVPGAWKGFARVYGHLGLIDIHLALWFFAVFGFYHGDYRWDDEAFVRVGFSVAWAFLSVACLWLAGVTGQRMLRGYGLTFLIIDIYTFYFQFVAANSASLWMLHLLLAGGSLIALGYWLERRLREHPLDTAST